MAAGGGKDSIRAFSQMTPRRLSTPVSVATRRTCPAPTFADRPIPRPMWSARTAIPSITPGRLSFCWRRSSPSFVIPAMPPLAPSSTCRLKHRVNEGVLQCTDCHNPHGNFAPSWRTGTGSNLVTASHENEEPCLKCHADKRGPFVFEHASVRVEGCMACHMPHGSTNAKLLKRPVVFTVCLEMP